MEPHRRQPRGGPFRHSRSRSRDSAAHDGGRQGSKTLPYKRRDDRRFRSHDSTFDDRPGRRDDRGLRHRRDYPEADRDVPTSPRRHHSPSPGAVSPRRKEERRSPPRSPPPPPQRSPSLPREGTSSPPVPPNVQGSSPPYDALETGPVSVELTGIPRHLNSVAHLADFWGSFGEVTNVSVNPHTRSALLTYSTLRGAQRATEVFHWDNHRIHVAIVRPPPPRPRYAPLPPAVITPLLPPVIGPRVYPVGPPAPQMIALPCPAWHPPPSVMLPPQVRMPMARTGMPPVPEAPPAAPVPMPPPRPTIEKQQRERKPPQLIQRKKALLMKYSEFLKWLVGNLNDKSRSEASKARIFKMAEVVKARIADLSKPAKTIVDELRMQRQLNELIIQAQSDPSSPPLRTPAPRRKEKDFNPNKLDNRPTSLVFTDLPVPHDDFPQHFVDTLQFNARMTTTLLRLPLAKLERSDPNFDVKKFVEGVNERRGACSLPAGGEAETEESSTVVNPPTREKLTPQTLIWIAQYECRWAAEQVFHRQKLLCTLAWWGPKHVRIPKAVASTDDHKDQPVLPAEGLKRNRTASDTRETEAAERLECERSEDEGTAGSDVSGGDGYIPALSDDEEYDREVKAWRTR